MNESRRVFVYGYAGFDQRFVVTFGGAVNQRLVGDRRNNNADVDAAARGNGERRQKCVA